MKTWKEKQLKAKEDKQINIAYIIIIAIGLIGNFIMLLNVIKNA